MDRNALQEQAAQILSEKKRLICQWATSVGKSAVVMKFLKKHGFMRTLILVPEQNNIENWTAEFDKFDVSMLGVEIACYASLHKYKDTSWDFLVIDEAPHVDTELRSNYLSTITAEYILALGAVISEDEHGTLQRLYGEFAVSRVSLDMAIAHGILPSPEIRIIHMKLDDKDKKYMHNGKKCTAKEMYEHVNAKVNNAVLAFNAHSTVFNKNRMNSAGNERKRFLGKLKQDALSYICTKLTESGKRYLCFCSSIKQAEDLGGDLAFTSKTPASMNLLQRFNNHEIDSLFVVGKLIEGQNLKDIHCGVIGQLGGTQRITIQEIGRILRSTNPVVFIPVFDGTKDDSFLYTLTSSVSGKYIKHYNF